MQNFVKKIQFHLVVSDLADLNQNWDTRFFSPTVRYINLTRLYMPCSGEGKIVCNGETFTIKKGAMLLIPPYAHIQVSCPEQLVKYWCHFEAPVAGLEHDIFSVFSNVTEIKITDEEFELNKKLFERLISIPKNAAGQAVPSPLDELCGNAALAMLLEPFLKMIPQSIVLQHDVDRITKLIQYMNENLASDITLKSLSQIAGLHPNYLSVIFQRCTGISPIAYLLRIRLNYVMTELRRGNLRMGEIAEKVGFSSNSAFSQFFRRQTGLSPREWLHRNR